MTSLQACRLCLVMLCSLGLGFADEQIIINDLDDLDDDDDDDEPMIVKVESAREREQAIAAKAQQELSRLQKLQLQAKFDHANHRKAQVERTSNLGCPPPPPAPPPAPASPMLLICRYFPKLKTPMLLLIMKPNARSHAFRISRS